MFNLTAFKKAIGPYPKKPALNAEVLETVDKGHYLQLLVSYNVEAFESIEAYLLLPKGLEKPAPAIFCHHQHASNFELGKSEVVGLGGDPAQALAPELAKLGYVVLAPDALAFESRNSHINKNAAEYFELASRIIRGQTLLAKVLHDVSVGIDYLAEHALVDKHRIGFIGHSYGGRMAIWAPAFDQRIKASVSNCGCVNYKDSLSPEVGIQPEFCLPNIMNHGDIEDLVGLIAPRALYISATNKDKYSLGAQAIFDYAAEAFPFDQLRLKIWPGQHIFSEEMRLAAYDFLLEKL